MRYLKFDAILSSWSLYIISKPHWREFFFFFPCNLMNHSNHKYVKQTIKKHHSVEEKQEKKNLMRGSAKFTFISLLSQHLFKSATAICFSICPWITTQAHTFTLHHGGCAPAPFHYSPCNAEVTCIWYSARLFYSQLPSPHQNWRLM